MQRSTSSKPDLPGPQFSIKGMFIFTSCVCVLFAILAAIGIPAWQILVGLLVMSLVSALTILAAELAMSLKRRGHSVHLEAHWRTISQAQQSEWQRSSGDNDSQNDSAIQFLDEPTSPFASGDPPARGD